MPTRSASKRDQNRSDEEVFRYAVFVAFFLVLIRRFFFFLKFMSAGSGVQHSEHNLGEIPVRFIQSWVLPRTLDSKPVYGSLEDSPERARARQNAFEHIVGDRKSETISAPVRIDADVNFFLAEVEAGKQVSFRVAEDRQAYILQVEGRSALSKKFDLEEGDAAAAVGSNDLVFDSLASSMILVIEMKRT